MGKKFENGTRVNIISGHSIGKTGIVLSERKTNDPSGTFSYKIECVDTGEIVDVLESKLEYDDCFMEMAGRIPGEAKLPGKQRSSGLIIAMGDGEQEIRHFHVYRTDNDKQRWANGACLFLNENRYYDHGKNRETLTEDELNAVIKKLKENHPTLGISNWKYLITLWNDNNHRYPIDPDTPMPPYDYKTITRYKEK